MEQDLQDRDLERVAVAEAEAAWAVSEPARAVVACAPSAGRLRRMSAGPPVIKRNAPSAAQR
jgi:hypothetical protein